MESMQFHLKEDPLEKLDFYDKKGKGIGPATFIDEIHCVCTTIGCNESHYQ